MISILIGRKGSRHHNRISLPGANYALRLGALCGRKSKDKRFCAWITEPDIVHFRQLRPVMNSLCIEGWENLRLGTNEPALAPSIQEWRSKKTVHIRRRETRQLGINGWSSLKHSSTEL